MNLLDAQKSALSLMNRCGLVDKGWTFVMHRSKTNVRWFGQCRSSRREICLAMPFVTVNPSWEVEQTIRHEIAHALAFEATGTCAHNDAFYACCTLAGCKLQRFNTSAMRPRPASDGRYHADVNEYSPRETIQWAADNGYLDGLILRSAAESPRNGKEVVQHGEQI